MMSKIIGTLKNNLLLGFVVLVYTLLMIFMPEKGVESFSNSLYYVKEMLTIMPVILILTSLIEAWVPKKTIESALGEGSGIKGYFFSFLLGSFSAGPIYAAFPVCKMLLKKGASVANIIIILSAWAVIKIPMLANEAKFLGPKFMAIRWVLTSIAILIIAIISTKIVKKEEIPEDDVSNNENCKLCVNQSFCIGCGICARTAPEYFLMENKKAKPSCTLFKSQENDKVRFAMDKCPAKAIEFM